MKIGMPKMAKPSGGSHHAPRLSRGGGHAAFGSGGSRAFNDPSTMVAPDQAFGAAMTMPQGGGAVALPPQTEGQ